MCFAVPLVCMQTRPLYECMAKNQHYYGSQLVGGMAGKTAAETHESSKDEPGSQKPADKVADI